MKKYIFSACLLFLAPIFVSAQETDYKVVFDLTSHDTSDYKAVIRWVNEIKKANPAAQVEVVLYGASLDMITKGKASTEGAVMKILGDKSAAFKVCAVAMQNHNIDKSQLIPGVEIVPDGIYEIVTKQHQGWAYIKAVR
ncbi:MAG: hypothetical protein C5B52_17755 [Bacteroidetes bacterium]|nr:MAG: hypothetical protein C5B52_17755 [Bacteroidota bacterium]